MLWIDGKRPELYIANRSEIKEGIYRYSTTSIHTIHDPYWRLEKGATLIEVFVNFINAWLLFNQWQ